MERRYSGADKFLATPGRKKATSTFMFPVCNHNCMNIYIYIYIYKLTTNELFSPTSKIHREVSRAKELPASLILI